METFEPKSILCGIDFSPASHSALACTALLCPVNYRRRPLLKASILGATTERVVRHATCPVLTVFTQWQIPNRRRPSPWHAYL